MTDPAGSAVEIRHLSPDEISLISEIDRSERIERVYRVVDGDLRLEEHTLTCRPGTRTAAVSTAFAV